MYIPHRCSRSLRKWIAKKQGKSDSQQVDSDGTPAKQVKQSKGHDAKESVSDGKLLTEKQRLKQQNQFAQQMQNEFYDYLQHKDASPTGATVMPHAKLLSREQKEMPSSPPRFQKGHTASQKLSSSGAKSHVQILVSGVIRGYDGAKTFVASIQCYYFISVLSSSVLSSYSISLYTCSFLDLSTISSYLSTISTLIYRLFLLLFMKYFFIFLSNILCFIYLFSLLFIYYFIFDLSIISSFIYLLFLFFLPFLLILIYYFF